MGKVLDLRISMARGIFMNATITYKAREQKINKKMHRIILVLKCKISLQSPSFVIETGNTVHYASTW